MIYRVFSKSQLSTVIFGRGLSFAQVHYILYFAKNAVLKHAYMRVFSILYQNEFALDLTKPLVGETQEDEAEDGDGVFRRFEVRELKCSQFDGDCCHDRLGMVLSEALLGFVEIERAIDKRDVREGLWIIAQRHVFLGVDFLGK